MAERITIKVEPSGRAEVLSVEDAMTQVLDAFALLVGPDERVLWRLVEASTNSPFMAVAEAMSLTDDLDAAATAQVQKRQFAEALVQIGQGEAPDEWRTGRIHKIALRFFRRNMNGVGRTTVVFDDEPVVVSHGAAIQAVRALSGTPAFELPFLSEDRSRTEVGSIEGWLLGVGTHYNQSAIRLRERKSRKEVWCRIPEEVRHQIADTASFKEVWEHKRVRVRGRIRYDEVGQVEIVYAQSIKIIEPRTIEISELHDPEFTQGLTAVDFLRRQREREFG